MAAMQLRPITLAEARRFVGEHHRHNIPPVGWKWGVGVECDGQLVGVAVASRPVARGLDDGRTLEITRSCTDGTRNANSMLYGAITRAARALGYARLVTYTLASEPGSSLKASGFTRCAELAPREDHFESKDRHRYALDLFGNERRPSEAKIPHPDRRRRMAEARRTISASDNAAVLGGMRAKNNGRYNGNGRHWETPPELFAALDAEFSFTLDPCAQHHTAKCERYFTEDVDGLAQDWGTERVFMNPPYGREVYAWTRKARESAEKGALVVGLLPASTDLAWWHDDVWDRERNQPREGVEVRYIRGRVRFLTGGPYRASGFFPSVVVVWRPAVGRLPTEKEAGRDG